MSNWSFVTNITDAFAETSMDHLKVIVSNISCYSSVKVVVLSEEYEGSSIIQLDLCVSCSRWVFDTSERWER